MSYKVTLMTAGQKLRDLRERLGYTMRDVEATTSRLAEARGNPEFCISPSRLSDFEIKQVVPSIFKLYALSVVYHVELLELFDWYGVPISKWFSDASACASPSTHVMQTIPASLNVKLPVKMDPAFDTRWTTDIRRMVQQWGVVPLAYLSKVHEEDCRKYCYGYIGLEDLMMYPLLLPGSFVQIDESRTAVEERLWRSEYERPIYFIETRAGFWCSWCSVENHEITLQPHPLSPAKPKVFKQGSEAEVIGQVVAVAMQLHSFRLHEPRKESRLLN